MPAELAVRGPKFGAPEVDVPEVEIPEVDIPDVGVPEVGVPEVGAPEVCTLGIRAPEDWATVEIPVTSFRWNSCDFFVSVAPAIIPATRPRFLYSDDYGP